MNRSSLVWPNDALNESAPLVRDDPNHVIGFLICPFAPQDVYDELYQVIQATCDDVGKSVGARIVVERADKLMEPNIIHADIWRYNTFSDFIIADVTGANGNVMLETGVTATLRSKNSVIIIKEETDTEDFLFDIQPARHILYKRTWSGLNSLSQNLARLIYHCLTPAPYQADHKSQTTPPFECDFATSNDVPWLVGPSILHRRTVTGYLEFGSLYIYRNSWLSICDRDFRNVCFKTVMRFGEYNHDESWIGISVRGQSCFANYNHLVYLKVDGEVIRTVTENDLGAMHNESLGRMKNMDLSSDYIFEITTNESHFEYRIGTINARLRTDEMPYVFAAGKCYLQTFRSRAQIKNISFTSD